MTSHIEELLDSYTIDDRLWRRGRNVLVPIAAGGWVACALAFALDPVRFHASYLVAYAFFLTLTLGALFFVMLQHLTGAAWSVTMRRMAENTMVLVPLGAVLFVPIALGLPSLYEWARPEAVAADPILRANRLF